MLDVGPTTSAGMLGGGDDASVSGGARGGGAMQQPEERQLLHPASADTKVKMVAQPTPRREKNSQLWLRHVPPHSPEEYSVL